MCIAMLWLLRLHYQAVLVGSSSLLMPCRESIVQSDKEVLCMIPSGTTSLQPATVS